MKRFFLEMYFVIVTVSDSDCHLFSHSDRAFSGNQIKIKNGEGERRRFNLKFNFRRLSEEQNCDRFLFQVETF